MITGTNYPTREVKGKFRVRYGWRQNKVDTWLARMDGNRLEAALYWTPVEIYPMELPYDELFNGPYAPLPFDTETELRK